MKEATPAWSAPPSPFAWSEWFDPLEEAVRGRVRAFIEQLLEEELEATLGRARYERGAGANGRRHGHRPRQLVTTFGPLTLSVPRARLAEEAGEREWSSSLLPAYQRLSHRAEALIAEAYLAGVNSRRVRRALVRLFEGHVGKDVVSRAWQKTRSAWQAWQGRDLTGDDIVRLILDGTVVKARLDRKATAISLLIALGVRRDGQKLVLAIKNMGGESEAAWRAVLDDLMARGMARPELVVVDGGKGLEAALASLWDDVPVQRCTVHKERNLLAHAPQHLHDEIKADFNDMVHAGSAAEVLAKRKLFLGQVETALSGGRRQPGGGRRAPVHLRTLPARAVALVEDHERHRACARGVQATDQDPVPAALRRDRRHAVLGAARLRSDHHAPRRWLADPGALTHRP
jgi:putative transposase